MLISGSYQGVPCFDGEYHFKNGIEPGRGYVRCKLSDLGGQLPAAANALQLKPLINRLTNQNAQIQMSSSPPKGVDTTSLSVGSSPGNQFAGLAGPNGVLQFKTDGEAEEMDSNDTDVTLQNIFWTEAVIEKMDPETGESIVKIELCDERILWGLGGYVSGQYNRVLNDVQRGASGRLFQWNPKKGGLSLTEVGKADGDIDSALPVLDERYIQNVKGSFKPWELYELLLIVSANLPGPPLIRISNEIVHPTATEASVENAGQDEAVEGSDSPTVVVPLNINWGAATRSKKALKDFMDRYALTIAPSYVGGFTLMKLGESAPADSGQPGGLGEGGSFIDPLNEVQPQFQDPSNAEVKVMSMPYKPVSVEIVGGKIYDEIACPDWIPVIRDDGLGDVGRGFGKVGRWVAQEDWFNQVKYSADQASISLMANYDKPRSKMFFDCPGETPEIQKKRRHMLHQHFAKSFMIAPGPFRRFLPMILKRPTVLSAGAGVLGTLYGQDSRFFTDGFDPEEIRTLGFGPLWANKHLKLVDSSQISSIDAEHGVITFKHPIGLLALQSKYAFDKQAKTVADELFVLFGEWNENVDTLSKDIAEWIDSVARQPGDFTFKDIQHIARLKMNEFVRTHGKIVIDGAQEAALSPTTIELVSKNIKQAYQEKMPAFTDISAGAGPETFNVTECQLIPPKILGIWTWERDWGRSDDYYRFRGGLNPAAPPYPLENHDLRQYIDITGGTNKEALDTLARIQIQEFLDPRNEAVSGTKLRFAGFHKVAMSGVTHDVTWRMSSKKPPTSTTEVQRNRPLHGIAGAPPSLATWSSGENPLRPT